jgi:glycosyltransferase involved in cell wall biosynthesis
MKILWLTWKDRKNPLAGGAEAVNEGLAERLVRSGHEAILMVAGFPNAVGEEMINGYKVIRLGNRLSVYWQAYRYYKKYLAGWADLVIDEVNTMPFFAKFYVKEKNILFVHQSCREIWFYEMFFPLNIFGYLVELIYLWLLRDREVITVSDSTKNDLLRFGFCSEKIKIISEGIEIEPINTLSAVKKFDQPTILSLGAMRRMKRTHEIIKAFELARDQCQDLRLVIAGLPQGRYGRNVLKLLAASRHRLAIEYLGKVSRERKIELMRQSHLVAVASVKEGWGLVVTEANSQGTPAVVYNVDGLRDAVKHDKTGLVCQKNSCRELAKNFLQMLNGREKYDDFRRQAWQWSREINFNRSYNDFIKILSQSYG